MAGCDAGPRADQPNNLPPVHITQVIVAQVDPSVMPVVVTHKGFDPADNSAMVSPTTGFRIRVDRLLDPTTANRQALCIRPFLGNVVDPSGCSAGVFTDPSYDPVLREIAFYQTIGNLVAGTRYEITLFTSPGVGGSGLLSYDGVALAQPLHFEFGVTDTKGVLPAYDTGPAGERFCTPADPTCTGDTCVRSVVTMLGGCALQGCHGAAAAGSDAGAPGQASEGLRLDGMASLIATALDHTAHETQTGENAAMGQPDSVRFGRSMAILSSKGPGYSYMIYKLLANPSTPLTVQWADAGEIDRLRSSIVVGMPMPPDTVPGAVLRLGEPEWLSGWLLQGAPVPATCGP